MHSEKFDTQREAKHIAGELHHLHGPHQEHALDHIRKDLYQDHKNHASHFNEMISDIRKELHHEHDHRLSSVVKDHLGNVKHLSFDHHDIFQSVHNKKHTGHEAHKHTKPSNKSFKDGTGKDNGSGYLDSANSMPSPSKDSESGYLDSSNSKATLTEKPQEPDVRSETIASILRIKGSGSPDGKVPYSLEPDGN